MDPDIDVCQTEQPQISYSVDFTAEQSSAMGSPNLYPIGSGVGRVQLTLTGLGIIKNFACNVIVITDELEIWLQ